jgi:ABC-type sugar transport system ATPase subunit
MTSPKATGASVRLVELKDVSKTFPGVKALDHVSLSINAGECLALVGENGAGKSTLMKVLSGTYPAGSFAGEILVEGRSVDFKTPLDAERAGIAIIHQELSGFRHLSVAENLFVGHWPESAYGVVSWEKIRTEAKKWLDAVGCSADPDTKLGSLAVGEQQMVEIAKALSRKSRVLILDEPTSALTPREVDTLFGLIKNLRSKGVGLVYISHKMEEIYALADRITILRDGKTVHTAMASTLNEAQVITHMVGRPLTGLYPQKPAAIEEKNVLEVRGFQGKSLEGKKYFGPLNFSVRKGEILGLAGLLGAGRSETLRGLFGDPQMYTSGVVTLNGRLIRVRSPRQALREGLAFVAEDRKTDSILPGRSLEENVSLARLVSGRLNHILRLKREYGLAKTSLKRLSTKATGPEQQIQQLSGGNQQKVILARALETAPEVILLDEPTRGVDVGAKYEIYEILFRLAAEGKALIVVSSDLPELMALADRIVILSAGNQAGELPRERFSQEEIMRLAVKS